MVGITLNPACESLDDGTMTCQQGLAPGIQIEFEFNAALALRRRGRRGVLDFDPVLFSTMVELVNNRNSTSFNFGPLLVSKMKEIRNEGQVYYWALRQTANEAQQVVREQYAVSRKKAFVRMGDFSDQMVVGRRHRPAGDFDVLSKVAGTTNCSTAVLDALYRALGGKINQYGRVIRVGGVNGLPLSDGAFSGFPKKFQGPEWDDAIANYRLGYKVDMKALKLGDIISKPGHRMIFLKVLEENRKGWPKSIKTIEAKPPTGNSIQFFERHPRSSWKAARIFDIRV
ncbi:MAG: hypothetical protein ACC707_02140 [Thiohalomonadales bacterium]